MNGTENFFAILDKAGSSPDGSPSTTNDLLVQALDRLHYSDPARIFVERAAKSNSAVGKRLARLEAWGKADGDIEVDEPQAPAQQQPALRPGTMVADAGASDQGMYTGALDPALMSDANKRYFADNLGRFSNKYGQVFSRDPNPFITSIPGNLANGERDPIVRDAQGTMVADLSAWS